MRLELNILKHIKCTFSLHPRLPLVATTSGQRTFIQQDECENDDNEEIKSDNSLRLWKLGCNADETKI